MFPGTSLYQTRGQVRQFLYNSKKINPTLIKREMFKNFDINKKTIYSDEVFLAMLTNNETKKKYNLSLNGIIKKIKNWYT